MRKTFHDEENIPEESAYPSSECELKIVGSKGVVLYGGVDAFVKKCGIAKKVLGYSEP